jgi:hypothetical protein
VSSPNTRLKILITEGSSGSAKETLYCIGDRHDIDLLDSNRLCQCRFTRFLRKSIRCPNFARHPDQYLKFLIDRVRSGRYDVLFPVHEQVYLLSRVREQISKEVAVALPDFETLRLMQSKSDFVRKLSELNIPIPKSEIVQSFDELDQFSDFPCYIKLAHSTGGTGVALVRDPKELSEVAARFKREQRLAAGTEIVVQKPAPGIMCVVQAVFQHGRMIASHCAEALGRGVGGGQGLRVSASHPVVVDHVRELGKHLNWHGALFFEYFYDRGTGQPLFIECNPRIGETYNAKLCGVNLCDLIVRISLGEKLEPLDQPVREGVRSFSDFFMLLQQAIGGANRRELLKESFQMIAKRGEYRDAVTEITRPSQDPLSLIPAVAVVAQLLLFPGLARSIVNGTVDNYSLPQAGVQKIHALTDEQLGEFFGA